MTPARYRLARYGGLLGALLLAVSAYLGGVFPGWRAGVTPVRIWSGEHGPWIVLSWLLGTGLLVGAWWSLRHGAPSLRWAYATVGLWLLPLLLAPPLGSRDVYSYACQGAVYATGHDPYRGGVAELGCPWLDSVSPIWRDTPAPYGPVFVLLAGLAVALGGTLVGTIAVLRVAALLGVVLTAACLPALARRCDVPPQRAVWLLLACPLVGVHLVSGAHNDAVMVGLLVAGLLLVVRRPGRPVPLLAGGALLGLAAAVKLTAVVVLPFAVLAGVVGGYRLRRLVRDGAWVLGGALAAVLAVTGLTGLSWGWVAALASSGESMQWTSPPTAVGFVVDYVGRLFGWPPYGVPIARLAALVLLTALLVALWWRTWAGLRRLGEGEPQTLRPDGDGRRSSRPGAGQSPRFDEARPRVWSSPLDQARTRMSVYGAGLALAATVVLAPVFHPWYATWPLAVLAVVAVRTGWFLVPCAVASFLTLPDGTNFAPFTKAPGAVAMVLLVVVLIGYAARHPGRWGPWPAPHEAGPTGGRDD